MAIFTSQDSLVAIAAGAIVLILAVVFTGVYLNVSESRQAAVAYASFEPISVKTHRVALRATVAIQTRAGNTRWAAKNRNRLDNVFRKTLAEVDPDSLRTPEGIQALQVKLKNDANRALDTDILEAVYLTDFLVTGDDD